MIQDEISGTLSTVNNQSLVCLTGYQEHACVSTETTGTLCAHASKEPPVVAFKQAFDESLWPEKAYAEKRPGPGNSRFKPLIDAFLGSGLSIIRHKYTTSNTDYRVGRKASNNVQSCIESYIRTNGLSDIIRVYRDNGYVCIARLNK